VIKNVENDENETHEKHWKNIGNWKIKKGIELSRK